ncbi:predicted protein [Verticillium alfalfae VaMs.102]|uniref:Predicted protein n=1 Tax=Verticillium alfalfae (strain VaMs.102 / ATCC MYA-4576 / FGSC 10136) TaxID=526221 RepID=C9SCG9_VERA1|nr:predicted protein [Verticillium alfalfae VaMs.102]EEY16784.1 predicted protein [Verticillium alfalfae VaMs.102]
MHLHSILGFLACLPLTFASTLPTEFSEDFSRSIQVTRESVASDINGIDTAVKKLIGALDPFEGGLLDVPNLVIVGTNFLNVHAANRKAFVNAKRIETQFSKEDSKAIIELVEQTLVITNPRATELVIRKKPAFDRLQSGAFARLGLELLLNDHLTLSDALVRWVEPSLRDKADEVVETITLALEDAIEVYS